MPIKPQIEELATRETSIYLVANQFARLMVPDDSVLETRGRDYKIYRETLRDDQCASTFGQRRLSVVAREWQVDPASESPLDVAAADSLRENLHKLDWDKITDLMLYSRWYGHGVAECMWAVEGSRVSIADIKVRDRSRFAYDIDDALYLQRLNGRFELMPERKFWTIRTGADHDDSPYGLGLAHYAYWPVYFKRAGIRFWLTFCEKFGTPTAAGKVPAGMINNPEQRQRCLDALNAIASETAILIPDGMEITLIEAARSGGGTYDDLVTEMDDAIAKLIVGQTASTEGTPGKLGNDKLQSDVRSDLVKADSDLICSSFNRQVATWLTEWNFPGAQPPRVWRNVEPPEDLVARAERDTKIFALGFEPEDDYITQTYGSGWRRKAAQAGLDPQQLPGQLAEEFAELGALATIKSSHRRDQQALVEAASSLADKYESIIGDRVRELISLAEETQDYATFAARLKQMLAEAPPKQTQQAVERSNIVARLMGALRAQR